MPLIAVALEAVSASRFSEVVTAGFARHGRAACLPAADSGRTVVRAVPAPMTKSYEEFCGQAASFSGADVIVAYTNLLHWLRFARENSALLELVYLRPSLLKFEDVRFAVGKSADAVAPFYRNGLRLIDTRLAAYPVLDLETLYFRPQAAATWLNARFGLGLLAVDFPEKAAKATYNAATSAVINLARDSRFALTTGIAGFVAESEEYTTNHSDLGQLALLDGWHTPEASHVSSAAPTASLLLPIKNLHRRRTYRLRLTGRAASGPVRVGIKLVNQAVGTIVRSTAPRAATIDLPLPRRQGRAVIQFDLHFSRPDELDAVAGHDEAPPGFELQSFAILADPGWLSLARAIGIWWQRQTQRCRLIPDVSAAPDGTGAITPNGAVGQPENSIDTTFPAQTPAVLSTLAERSHEPDVVIATDDVGLLMEAWRLDPELFGRLVFSRSIEIGSGVIRLWDDQIRRRNIQSSSHHTAGQRPFFGGLIAVQEEDQVRFVSDGHSATSAWTALTVKLFRELLQAMPARMGCSGRAVLIQQGDHAINDFGSVAYGKRRGMAPAVRLIADPLFFASRGHDELRRAAAEGRLLAWCDRDDAIERLEQVPRIAMCLALTGQPGADVGIIKAEAESFTPSLVAQFLRSAGIYRQPIPMLDHARYRYLIDIDGGGNAWSFFEKLLLGSCVIKVMSPLEQWFYRELAVWQHFVPVNEDLSDLAAKIDWCRTHPNEAQVIAEAGQQVAMRHTYEVAWQIALHEIGDCAVLF